MWPMGQPIVVFVDRSSLYSVLVLRYDCLALALHAASVQS